MFNQIRLLTKLQLQNLFGINVMLHTKDKKKKHNTIALGFVWLLLIAMMIFYIGLLAVGYVQLGLANIIPMYLYTLTSIIILFFSFFKASSVIFQMTTYEVLVSLPVSKSAIVISRFLTMYVTNLLLSYVAILPGLIIYGIAQRPSISFYVYAIVGILFLPLLPITLATAVGALITAITARMRHKSLGSAVLSILLCMGIMIGSFTFSSGMENMTEEMFLNLEVLVREQISRIYPLAIYFNEATVDGRLSSLLLLMGIPLLIFIAMIMILQNYFLTICTALNATSAKNNYKMTALQTNAPLKALWKKELKRYFASSIYVTNTIIGYIMMTLAAVSLCVVTVTKPELFVEFEVILPKALPFVLGFMGSMMPVTSCAISMEGKQWWLAQSLPVSPRDLLVSKMLVNLTVAAPFYVVSVVAGVIAVSGSWMHMVAVVVIPAVYIVFSTVMALCVNLKLPLMEWDNEVRVVKQSASGMVSMLVGFVAFGLGIGAVLLLPSSYEGAVIIGVVIVLSVLTSIAYKKITTAKPHDFYTKL